MSHHFSKTTTGAAIATAVSTCSALAAPPSAHPGALDTTPPALTAFSAPATFTQTGLQIPLVVSYTATDDLSGVSQFYAWAAGPGGQRLDVFVSLGYPALKIAGFASSGSVTSFLQAGTYTFVGANVTDLAGNVSSYDQAALSALGNVTVTVQNSGKFDAHSPVLDSGQILTPVVSLSSSDPGTSQPPFVGASIKVTDAGDTAVAGLRYIDATFCLADSSHCFTMSSWQPTAVETRQATLRVGYQLNRSIDVPGVYELANVSIGDYAANNQYLQSIDFGGSTDFTAYFPTTTIELDP
jgi:hypothetical protein